MSAHDAPGSNTFARVELEASVVGAFVLDRQGDAFLCNFYAHADVLLHRKVAQVRGG